MKKTIFTVNAVCLILMLVFGFAGCASPDEVRTGENIPPESVGIDIDADADIDDKLPEEEKTGEYESEEGDGGDADEPAAKIISVSAGDNHTMALDDKGRLWAWGDNYYGQVGDGNISTYHDPVYEEVPWSEYEEMVDGRVRNIDNDVYTPKYIMDNVKEIYARRDSSFAVTNDGKLYAWGRNDSGQLCDGTTEHKSTPAYIMDGVLYIDVHSDKTIIIKTDDSLWITGTFGFSFFDPQVYPVPTLFYENVKKAVFDDSHPTGLVILTNDNKVISYAPEELNSSNFIFKELSGLHNVIDISAATQQVYTLNTSGEVCGWGANGDDGRLGAMGDEFWVREPILITSDIRKILQGRMFIKNDGTLLTWGAISTIKEYRDSNGNDVGGGLTGTLKTYGKTPVPVLDNIAMADGRGSHYIALDNDGNVYTWGQNFYGQLGNGGSEDQAEPQRIVFPEI